MVKGEDNTRVRSRPFRWVLSEIEFLHTPTPKNRKNANKSVYVPECFRCTYTLYYIAFLAKNGLGVTTLGDAPRALPGRVGGLGR